MEKVSEDIKDKKKKDKKKKDKQVEDDAMSMMSDMTMDTQVFPPIYIYIYIYI